MDTKKIRLDTLLIQRGYCDHEKQAQAFIMTGKVLINDQKITKPGTSVLQNAHIRILGQTLRYVSRAGDKLHGAWEAFGFDIHNRVALDIGISTGGFTDFLRKHNIQCVFGVDVSYGILDFQLRQWPGLILLERTNAKQLTSIQLKNASDLTPWNTAYEHINLVVMDVSFISVTSILPSIIPLVQPLTDFVILIKPQFEAFPNEIPEGGVISDSELQRTIVDRVKKQLEAMNFLIKGECKSPITGTKGNQEYFLWMTH